jgi:hypothetical protein
MSNIQIQQNKTQADQIKSLVNQHIKSVHVVKFNTFMYKTNLEMIMLILTLMFMRILLPMLMPILMFYLISINSYKVQNQI